MIAHVVVEEWPIIGAQTQIGLGEILDRRNQGFDIVPHSEVGPNQIAVAVGKCCGLDAPGRPESKEHPAAANERLVIAVDAGGSEMGHRGAEFRLATGPLEERRAHQRILGGRQVDGN